MLTDSDHTINQKVCRACGQSYPATVNYFPKSSSTKDGLYPYCKPCANAKNRDSYNRNREAARSRANARRATQREETNRKNRLYYAANRKKINQKNAAYQKANRDKWRVYYGVHQARRLDLPAQFSEDDWNRALTYFDGRCAYCGNLPGLFQTMKLSVDHYVPLSFPDCPGTVPANIVPACVSCNASKHSKPAELWLIKRFGKRKAKEIAAKIAAYFQSLKD